MVFVDKTSPVITCEESIVLAVDEQCRASIPSILGNVTDNCDSNVTIVQSMAIGTIVPAGQFDIVVSVTDKSNNTVTIYK